MDQGTNRSTEITYATFSVEGVNSHVNKCTRAGCEEAADGLASPDLCTSHRKDQRRRQRECMQRKRDDWSESGQCTRCGGVRYPESRWCAMCLRERGLLAPAEVNKDVNKGRVAMRLEQSPDGVPRLRKRFVGQLKRGRRSIESMDGEDLQEAREALGLGADQLAYANTNAVKILPRVQRDDVKNQALAKLVEAYRWISEVVRRHGYEIPVEIQDDEDDE